MAGAVRWLPLAVFAKNTPPPIGEGLSQSAIEGENQFDERVKQLFPVGSQVEPMVQALMSQGFRGPVITDGNGAYLVYQTKTFPVFSRWYVSWHESDGVITDVWGVFGHVGP